MPPRKLLPISQAFQLPAGSEFDLCGVVITVSPCQAVGTSRQSQWIFLIDDTSVRLVEGDSYVAAERFMGRSGCKGDQEEFVGNVPFTCKVSTARQSEGIAASAHDPLILAVEHGGFRGSFLPFDSSLENTIVVWRNLVRKQTYPPGVVVVVANDVADLAIISSSATKLKEGQGRENVLRMWLRDNGGVLEHCKSKVLSVIGRL